MFNFKSTLFASALCGAVLSAGTASAATFNFVFDTNVGITNATPQEPFVGTGTLSFDGMATVGDTLISDLINLDIDFTVGGSAFDETDITTDTTTVSLSVTDSGSDLSAIFVSSVLFGNGCGGGALDFFNGTSCLTTGPASFEGLFQVDALAGSYQGSLNVPSAVPLPAGLPLLLGGFGMLAFVRRRKLAE